MCSGRLNENFTHAKQNKNYSHVQWLMYENYSLVQLVDVNENFTHVQWLM